MAFLHDPVAHGVIGHDRRVAALDGAYAALLGHAADGVVGRCPLAFTHPDDRAAAAALLDRAFEQSAPITATKRYLKPDGSAVWVCVHVSRIGAGDARQLVFSCTPLADAAAAAAIVPSAVEAQYRAARLLAETLRRGKQAFGAELVGNPASDVLLALYLAEAEARPALAQDIAGDIGMPWHLAERWLRALIAAGHVEAERAAPVVAGAAPAAVTAATPMRLTQRAVARMEAILRDVTAAPAAAMPSAA